MRRIATSISLALGATLAVCGCSAGDTPRRGGTSAQVAVGSPVPLYSAATLEGDTASLADLEGQVVLFNIWATWCHPCRAEIPELQALHEKYERQGFELVGVSVDGENADRGIREFMSEFGMTYTIWRDPEERALSLFRTIGVPATFLIDRDGVLRWRMTGPIRPGDTTLVRAIETALAAPAPGE